METVTEIFKKEGKVVAMYCATDGIKVIQHFERRHFDAQDYFIKKHGEPDFKLLEKNPYNNETAEDLFRVLNH